MSNLLLRTRKFGLSARLRAVARRGGPNAAKASTALSNFDRFFDFTMEHYYVVVPEPLDSQTPWLDAIREFFRWLDESGLLDLLLELFLGLLLSDGSSAGGTLHTSSDMAAPGFGEIKAGYSGSGLISNLLEAIKLVAPESSVVVVVSE
jgi:hypothetical protein